MRAEIKHKNRFFRVDFSKPVSIGYTIKDNASLNAWGASSSKIRPVVQPGFVGEIDQGGLVNFKTLELSVHANCTHTECVGHILKGDYTLNNTIDNKPFFSRLITVNPEKRDADFIITEDLLEACVKNEFYVDGLIIRTGNKIDRDHTNTNAAYFTKQAVEFINSIGVKHLLVDLPSVDKEKDGGKLLAHKTFWNIDNPLINKSITELVDLPEDLQDGYYFTHLSFLNIKSDASPSNPILYSADLLNVD